MSCQTIFRLAGSGGGAFFSGNLKETMSAWDTGIFDNDAACDWAAELEEAENFFQMEEVFDQVLEAGDEMLEADLACEALAAAEIVARSLGNWGKRDEYTAAADEWVENADLTPEPPMVEKALEVMNRIIDGECELHDSWEDDEAWGEWIANARDLRERLKD